MRHVPLLFLWVLASILAAAVPAAADPITKRNNDAGLGPWRIDTPRGRHHRRAVRHSRPAHRTRRTKPPVETDGAE